MGRPVGPRERPIIFSGPMVRAIRGGAKTQTRRLVRPQPRIVPADLDRGFTEGGVYDADFGTGPMEFDALDLPKFRRSPYGERGDRLWVRETWRLPVEPDGTPLTGIEYRATAPEAAQDFGINWRPSIFMPREASRVTLEVEAVRVERLQEISEADAIAEGLREWPIPDPHHARWSAGLDSGPFRDCWEYDPRRAFKIGWDAINGKRGPWASNPWVWCLTFRRLP